MAVTLPVEFRPLFGTQRAVQLRERPDVVQLADTLVEMLRRDPTIGAFAPRLGYRAARMEPPGRFGVVVLYELGPGDESLIVVAMSATQPPPRG